MPNDLLTHYVYYDLIWCIRLKAKVFDRNESDHLEKGVFTFVEIGAYRKNVPANNLWMFATSLQMNACSRPVAAYFVSICNINRKFSRLCVIAICTNLAYRICTISLHWHSWSKACNVWIYSRFLTCNVIVTDVYKTLHAFHAKPTVLLCICSGTNIMA